MDGRETIQLIAFAGFIFFIALPLLGGTLWLLNSPAATMGDALAILERAIIPWWIGLAKTAPILFVILVGLLVWAGAEDVL